MSPPLRLLVRTESGSLYAFYARPDTRTWWLRPRSIPSLTALPLADRWVRIEEPVPWPPSLDAPLELVFPSSTPDQVVSLEGVLLAFHVRRRRTAALVELSSWSPSDAWPGDPTMTTEPIAETL